MNAGGHRWRRLRLVLGYGIAAAAVYFTIARFEISLAELWHSVSAQHGGIAAASLALFTLHGAMNAAAFGYLLRSFGAVSSVAANASAWGGSVLAKYIPGGVWQVIGRGVILQRQGVSPRAILWSSLLEQLISLLACAAVVLIVSRIDGGVYAGAWLAGLVVLLLVLLPPWLLPSAAGLSRTRVYIVAAGLYIVALAPYAAAYLLLVSPASPASFIQGLFEGTIAGVLAILAPGGLGVRESWVVISQVDQGGRGMLGALLLARALIVLSEIALTLASLAYGRRLALRQGECL